MCLLALAGWQHSHLILTDEGGLDQPGVSNHSAWMDSLLTTESELVGGGFATRPKTQGNE